MSSNQLTFPGPEFFEGQDLLTIEEDARRGRYSGVIIERNREKFEAIVRALAEGFGVDRVAKAFSVHVHTVLGIRDRHPDLIAGEKKDLSRLAGRFLKLSLERLVEGIIRGEISPAQLSVPIGIIADKKLVWDGEATARIEHITRRELDPADVAAALDALRRSSIQVESEVQKALPPDSESAESPLLSQ